MSPMASKGPAALMLIVRRSLRQHALSTSVTVLSAALAIGLTMAVFSIKSQTYDAFTGGPIGFDAVLGARGSQLQLVLNTVFHLETSPGNVPWSMYQTMKQDPQVELAIPYAVGDNFYGYRIVGTTAELFEKFEYQKGRKFEIEPPGRVFDPNLREAIVGSYVAQKLGLRRGSKFKPFHGLGEGGVQHGEEYIVVGVMKPTNSPSDRVIWIPIEGIFRMGGHRLRGGGEDFEAKPGQTIPDEHKEVSAVMLKFRNTMAGMRFDQTINKQGKVATLAWPIGAVMADLFDKVGWMNRVMALVAYMVVVVAAGSILASLYNSMNERRREFAILRSLGARRRTVFSVIVMESSAIAFLGCVVGYLIYAAIFVTAAQIVRAQTGVVLDFWYPHPVLVLGPLAMIALGALAGIAPAIKAYSTDVATNLTPVS